MGDPVLDVDGIPFVFAFCEDPILSIQVRQLCKLPPYIKPVDSWAYNWILKPSVFIWESI